MADLIGGPKTIEEARALPELRLQDEFNPDIFLGSGIEGDSIILFVDSDGVSKKVECIRRSKDGPDEWVKVVFTGL